MSVAGVIGIRRKKTRRMSMARKVSKKKTTRAKKATRKVKAAAPRGMAKRVNKVGTEWGF
jgi:hypothetical protein